MNPAAFGLCLPLAIAIGCSLLRGANANQADPNAAQALYDTILADEQAAMAKFVEARHAAKNDDERREAFVALYPKPADYAPRFSEVAQRFPDTSAAVDALVEVVKRSRSIPATQEQALEILRANYLESERIGPVCQALVLASSDPVDFLRAVAAKNPHHAVQGVAWLSLGQRLKNTPGRAPGEVEKILQQAAEAYDDVPLAARETVSGQARRELFIFHNLEVGRTAPEVVGSDVDGTSFKLSDYRGKVVVLDFWGRW